MLSQDSLNNDNQKELYNNLKQAIEDGSDPHNILGGSILQDVDAVFGIRITTEDGYQHNFLTYAIKYNNDRAVAHILIFARTSLKNLLNDRPMIGTYKNEDNLNIAYYMTALEYARERENEECERLIVQQMDFERMPVPDRQNLPPLDEGSSTFSETSATSAKSPFLQQDVHSQDPETEDYLKDIIMDHSNDTKTIHTAITHAIKHGDIAKVYAILRSDNQDTLRTLFNKEATIQYADGTERKYTALSYAEIKGLTDLAKKIERKMHELAPAHEGQSPIGASNRVFEEKISTPVSGPDQQGDDIRSLYAQLDNNIVNGSAQIAKDSLNKLLLHDDEKFQEIVDFKERGMVSLRDKIQQKLEDVVHYQGDQELIEMLKTCVGRNNQIDAKLEDLDQQQTVNAGRPASPAAHTTPAIPPLSQPGWHEPLNGTGGLYLHKESISSEGLDDEGSPSDPDYDAYLREASGSSDNDNTSKKSPTFWDKHKGKIAVVSGVVGMLCVAGAVFAGLPLEIACIVGVIGGIAILAAGKMVYDKVSDKAEKWGVSKSEAARTILSKVFSSQPGHLQCGDV